MVDREFRVISALAATNVPVAKPRLYCEDASLIGSEFFIMDYVAGRIFWDPSLPQLTAAERRAIYRAMASVLARLHSVDLVATGLSDYGKPGNYFARQITRWSSQYEAAKTEPLPAMDALMAWLPQNIPADTSVALVHGDYPIDNMIFHPTEPRVLAVLGSYRPWATRWPTSRTAAWGITSMRRSARRWPRSPLIAAAASRASASSWPSTARSPAFRRSSICAFTWRFRCSAA